MHSNAELAELADAHVSGACDREVIRVQVPGSALDDWVLRIQMRCIEMRLNPGALPPGFSYAAVPSQGLEP